MPSLGVCGLVDGDVDETTWGAFILSVLARKTLEIRVSPSSSRKGESYFAADSCVNENFSQRNCGLEDVIFYRNKNF